MNITRITQTFAVALVLVLTAAGLWAAGAEEEPTAAAEKEMVMDPSTGEMVTAPEYGGTLTFVNRGCKTIMVDSWFGGFGGSTQAGVTEKLGIAKWELDRDQFSLRKTYVPVSVIGGSLAESWEQPDANTYIFHIREGVRWHDKAPMNGRELVAEDVVFNWHRMVGMGEFAAAGGSPSQTLRNIPFESITATDRYTVVFKTTAPQSGLLHTLLVHHATWNYPPEVIEEHGDLQDWRNSVGTGPYMLTDAVEGSSITWTKNPDYWRFDEKYPDNRLPYIDELTALFMSDTATIDAGLRSGSIDYIGLPGGCGAQIDSIDRADALSKSNPELELTEFFQRAENAISFKLMDPPFNDIKVRIAMQLALDLETINNTFYKGYASATPQTLLGDAHVGYSVPFEEWPDDVKEEYTYNPQRAEQLLDEAGYPRGADGIRFKTDFLLIDTFDLDYPQLAATYFDAIGVDVEINVVDRPAFLTFLSELTYEGMFLTIAGRDAEAMDVVNWYHSSRIGTQNYSGLRDPVFDAMFDEAKAAATVEEQQRLVREIDLYLARNHFLVWSPKVPWFNVNQPWVKGYNGEVDLGWGDRNTVFSRIWIDQDLKREMGH